MGGMDSGVGIALLEPVPCMVIFLAAFDDIPGPRADNARHDLCELLVVGFVAVLCDLPLNFHPAATGARLVFTPIGAG